MRVPLIYRAESRTLTRQAGAGGAWYGTWAERKLYLKVAGSDAAPDPALEATLWRIVDDFDEIARAIEAFTVSFAAVLDAGRPIEITADV